MPDDDKQAWPLHELIGQLRGLTDRLTGAAGLSGIGDTFASLPSWPSVPRPAALTTSQLKAVTSTLAAQRSSIAAMQAQLQAFDEQLTVMEKVLEPLNEWSATWAELERRVMDLRPGSGD